MERSIRVGAPPEAVWAVLTDPSWYPRAFADLVRWEPAGATMGPGTSIELRLRVGAAPVGGRIEVVAFEPGRRLAWAGRSGVIGDGGWRLSAEGADSTSVSLVVTYRTPGPLGGLADRAALPSVRRAVTAALEALRATAGRGGEAHDGKARGGQAAASDGEVGRVGDGREAPAASSPLGPVGDALVLARAGLLDPANLLALVRGGPELARSGLGPAGAYAVAAARFPERPAVVDDSGTLTFADMHRRVGALAAALSRSGIAAADSVAVMCRNHRYFLMATAALSRLGADVVLLNTSFAAPQVLEVLGRHRAAGVVLDEEFLPRVEGSGAPRFLAWTEPGGAAGGAPRLDDLAAGAPGALPRAPRPGSRYVLLTSGTTGAPRSAGRPMPLALDPIVAPLSRIPLRVGDTMLIASPLFHALGFGYLGLALLMSSTLVLQRTFDPEATLAAVDRNRVRTLVLVPLMLKRLVELAPEVRTRYDTSSLQVVISSGSALGGELANRFMDAFGDVVYNVYGSTEASWATIARPEDLRAAPGTVGRPPRGTVVRVLDPSGGDAPAGVTGPVVVGNVLSLRPDGSSSDGELVPTGDLGHLDDLGRLFVDGRQDDMIVSGGENVYPQPVEDALLAHPAIDDAAVTGVADREFGQRLRALVVLRPGHELTAEAVRRYLADRLPRYAVPRDVEFVESLPHNATGKTLHNLLRP
ncbi:MAG TPA: AMP-binding protein [Acidimicrobiales bacterium]|nr:AMP-binding protein [Acidimicrobiales bacterium]